MEPIGNDVITQETYGELLDELMLLQAEEKFEGKSNKDRITEIKTLLQISD